MIFHRCSNNNIESDNNITTLFYRFYTGGYWVADKFRATPYCLRKSVRSVRLPLQLVYHYYFNIKVVIFLLMSFIPSGSLPHSIGNLKNLVRLDLSENQLTGTSYGS
jgi:Leucine-rich repeat (LRR) protein